MFRRVWLRFLLVIVCCLVMGGCKHLADGNTIARSQTLDDLTEGGSAPTGGACVALRGNGRKIFAHFSSVARLVEETGPIKAFSGGSSSTVTMFLYESILANPNLNVCGNEDCSAGERTQRIALMMKSLVGYFDVIATSDELAAALQLTDFFARVQSSSVDEALDGTNRSEADALRELMASAEFRRLYGTLLNPKVDELLDQSPNRDWHAKDIRSSVASDRLFVASDQLVFLRPFLIDWNAAIEIFGRIGDLYASRGADTAASQARVYAACSSRSKGKSWSELGYVDFNRADPEASFARPSACTLAFQDWVGDYFAKVRGREGEFTSRLFDPIGRYVKVFPTTGLIVDPADQDALRDAERRYWQADLPTDWETNPNAWFAIDFAKMRIGYWGSDEDLEAIDSHIRGENPQTLDAKSKRFFPLGIAPWYEVLSASPAEPSLSSFVPLPRVDAISVGGWADLQPTLIFDHLDCAPSIFVTRVGEPAVFARDVMLRLSANQNAIDDLLSMDPERRPRGAHRLSIDSADAVWCTDWNQEEYTSDRVGTHKVSFDTFRADFETRNSNLALQYSKRFQALNRKGCSVGVP